MPIITLTSDFGNQSHVLPSVKGTIHQYFNDIDIIDIAHHFLPFNLQQVVYVFKNAYTHFPEQSIHFVLNDLYASKQQQLLYVYENGQHIFCPDNGFLTMLFDDKPFQVFKINEPITTQYNYLSVAKLYCESFTSIYQGNRNVLSGVSAHDIVIKKAMYPHYENDSMEVQVLHIDAFENVILNVTKNQIEEVRIGRKFKILIMRDEEITQIHQQYSDVAEGDMVAFFNSTGHLEIAINRGNAASLFGFSLHNEKSLFYNHIKIFFE